MGSGLVVAGWLAVGGRFASAAAVAVVVRAEEAEVGGGGGVAAAVVVGAAEVALVPGVVSSARRGLVRVAGKAGFA